MLAIIGGTGLYDLAGLRTESHTSDDTPLLVLAGHGAGQGW